LLAGRDIGQFQAGRLRVLTARMGGKEVTVVARRGKMTDNDEC